MRRPQGLGDCCVHACSMSWLLPMQCCMQRRQRWGFAAWEEQQVEHCGLHAQRCLAARRCLEGSCPCTQLKGGFPQQQSERLPKTACAVAVHRLLTPTWLCMLRRLHGIRRHGSQARVPGSRTLLRCLASRHPRRYAVEPRGAWKFPYKGLSTSAPAKHKPCTCVVSKCTDTAPGVLASTFLQQHAGQGAAARSRTYPKP